MTDALLTSVVGSHARPSWFVSGIDAAERGEFGPADLAEMLDDAVDLALRDQEEAGIDLVTATARCAVPASSPRSSTGT